MKIKVRQRLFGPWRLPKCAGGQAHGEAKQTTGKWYDFDNAFIKYSVFEEAHDQILTLLSYHFHLDDQQPEGVLQLANSQIRDRHCDPPSPKIQLQQSFSVNSVH
ncbi:hypothetical protein CEXT_285141 [Caerostris extrusa]|uniref:Uncharacterized protein n=1 Tax=Caerostris extrusa TaxID=172846 RepID=A0AAV4VA36_CAEEX|nr:hypothetical protein CEXT_285141 [Caerostris extrusa]